MAYLCKIPAIFIAITVTGFTKSICTYFLGDKAQKKKLLSMLNPLVHFETIGFLVYLFYGYGWGNPVEKSTFYFKDRRKAKIIINTMPIAVNAIIAVIFKIGLNFFKNTALLSSPIAYAVLWNIPIFSAKTAIINLLPVYPFCGWDILMNTLPSDKMMSVTSNKSIFQVVFILLLITGLLTYVLDRICFLIFGLG
jgi:Zn-dependent protease